MAPHVKDMTAGRPVTLIASFALPLMLGNVFQQLYTVVDTVVVGKGLGVGALAALGAVEWLNWMMLGIIQGLTQGFAILMAQEFGARAYDRLRMVVGTSVVLSLISAAALVLVGQLSARPVLLLMQTPQEILPDALLYLRIMFYGTPAVMAYNLLACILRALGDGKTPLYAMIVASFVNIVLDLLFVLVFRWGVAGAAAATVMAQVLSSVFCLLRLRKVEVLQLDRSHIRLQPGLSGRLFVLGWPMAFQNAIIALGGMIVTAVVNGFGVLFIAGFTATNKLYGILEIAATSYGYAMITYVGQNLGAGNLQRIRKGTAAANVVAVLTSLVIAVLMILFGRNILSCFISGTPQEVAQTMDVAYQYLRIMSVCLPVLYILYVVRSAVQGMGNTVLPMVSGISEFVMRTVGALLLPVLLGETGVFFAEIMAWTGADLILIPSYYVTIRKMEKTFKRKGDF